ncbi:MAG: HAMP domain-containing protein [Planctomycetes bacterium]|nr:HAMP domain-containing protein [Planctomycetota bacterium]MCB9903707.1 HAMP domain-containing protein [Planctomycetota bacterium]
MTENDLGAGVPVARVGVRPHHAPLRRRSGFFWKLAAAFAGVVLVAASCIGWLLNQRMEATMNAELQRGLERSAVLMGESFLDRTAVIDDAHARELSLRTGMRLTWIDAEGRVIADSHSVSSKMESHLGREEIIQAKSQDFGVVARYSTTIREELLYVARAVHDDEGQLLGYTRASVPLSAVLSDLQELRRLTVIGATLGTVLAWVVGLLVARRISRPIREVRDVAEALVAGDYSARVQEFSRDEIGMLGAALHRLSSEITRRLAEASLSEARLRAMLAGMVEGVVAVDESDRVLFCNAAGRKLLDPSGGDLEGQHVWESVRIAGLGELLEGARDERGLVQSELTVIRGGELLTFSAQASPFMGGGASGVVAVLHDVTALRRLENVRRDFVANVSHELKTPLTSIQAYVETLLDGALHDQENNERFLRKIDHHVRRLSALVSDLLSLARIESQADGIDKEPVALSGVLAEAGRLVESSLAANKVTLELQPADQQVLALGDRQALVQVAFNLVENAVKYNRAGGKVTIACGREGDRVYFRVTDTGVGIPKADRQRVFERFYRVDKARSRDVGGTGLGLAIVKHLVNAHGGRIDLQSREGEGSAFTVWLPASE